MNMAEKIAATYLRLNGFLLLPHFTVLAGGRHGHIDVIGLRAAGSVEVSRDLVFPVDDTFFDVVNESQSYRSPLKRFLGVAAEVRTNDQVDRPGNVEVEYVRSFLGNVPIVLLAFAESSAPPSWSDSCLEIGNAYALNWILERIDWIQEHHEPLKKTGSWTWSEDALADFLVLRRYGSLQIME